MKQAGASRSTSKTPSTGKESLRILLLCIALVAVAILAGYISMLLVHNAFEDLEADRAAIDSNRTQLYNSAASIERHLGDARAVITNILYRPGRLEPAATSAHSLGQLNKRIRDLRNLLPQEELLTHSKELDNVASNFVALHYSALNWRTRHELHLEEVATERPLGKTRDYLHQLQVAFDNYASEKRLRLQRLVGSHSDATGADDDSHDATHEFLRQAIENTRHSFSTIRAELIDIGRLIESLANAASIDELMAIREQHLEPGLEKLHRHFDAIEREHGDWHLMETNHIAELTELVLASNSRTQEPSPTANGTTPLYNSIARDLLLNEGRNQLNERLTLLTGDIAHSLVRVTGAIEKYLVELDNSFEAKSAEAWDRLLATQASSAGIFLLIVILILQAVRNQVNQLSALKLQAEDASCAKNRLMKRMQASETRQRAIVETMFGALITIDGDGNIESFNPAAEQMFGYRAREIIGKNALMLVPANRQIRYSGAAMSITRETGNPLRTDIRARARHRDGSEFPVSLAISNMVIDGRLMYTAIVMDITDLVEAEQKILDAKERAESSDRAKGEFLATMSHEIRTPMNAILGMSELLLESRLNSRQHQLASRILQSGRLLLHLINDVLDLSRIEANRLQLHPEAFNIHELMSDTGLLFHAQANRKALEVHCNIKAGMHKTWLGDITRLRQIINNLMANAIKFTHSGNITLSVGTDSETPWQSTLRFSVRDTGIGVSRDAQAHIFDSFSQADGSTTRRYGGSGLGLTICRKLAHLMGGEIGVISDGESGSEFWFTVTLQRAGNDNSRLITPPFERHGIRPLNARVLLVEDNLINREVATYMLESMRCEVTVAADGAEALMLLGNNDFDLVLMDCQMPVMDGYEATREIRQREASRPNRHLPVIALTANAMGDAREQCLAAGMDDYLSKPLTLETLYTTLDSRLRHNPARDSDRVLPRASPSGRDSPSRQTLNPACLEEFRDVENGSQLMQRIIDLYLDTAPGHLQELRIALQQDNAQALGRVAHTFKSGCAQLGAEKLAALCTRLDRQCRSGSLQDATQLVGQIEVEFSRVRKRLLQRQTAESRPARPALEIVH